MQHKEGLSQKSRWLKALDPDYVKIDDHSFEELLTFAIDFADLLNFYETDNKPHGTWKNLLTTDLTVILSYIITEDIKKYEDNYRRTEDLLEQTGVNNEEVLITYYKGIFNSIVDMAKLFDFWIFELRKFTQEESAFHDELEQAVKQLKEDYKLLQMYDLGAARDDVLGGSLNIDYGQLSSFRFSKEIVADASVYKGDSVGEKIKHAVEHVKPLFSSFFDTLMYIKSIAPKYLEESLTRNDHHPQIGLLIVFLKLFKKAQNNLNSIKARHTDFYYRDVLQQLPLGVVPDKVHLCFQLTDGISSYELKKGTRFLGGKDSEGNIRLYETNNNVRLNQTTIQEIRTLYVSKNKYIEVGSSEELISGIYEERVVGVMSEGNEEDQERLFWATLGEDQIGVSNEGRTMRDATIGFAIASPALRLYEGEREISFELNFRPESFQAFKEHIKTISDNTDSTFSEVFFTVFKQAFHISLSAENGWLLMQKYIVECPSLFDENSTGSSIKVSFHLSGEAPALININRDIHGDEFASKWPIVRLLMNKDSYIYPYSLMSSLILNEITINTTVDEIRDIVVYNDLGQLSTDEPFFPFGSMPKDGSYMLIGSKEVFNKAVNNITIRMDWADLPKQDGGFSDYYRGYDGYNIDNTSFKINFSLLKDGKWEYPNAIQDKQFYLFETEDKTLKTSPHPFSSLEDSTSFDKLSLDEFKLTPKYDTSDTPLKYDATTKNGFIKLELTGDEVMFGHKKYPFIISDIFLKNASIKREKKKKEIPNEPYSPKLNSVRLGYTNSKTIKFITESGAKDESAEGEVFHIMPFQLNKRIYPAIDSNPAYLVPKFAETGNLYIGLAGLQPPDTITLFFNILDKNVASYEDTDSDLQWHYLADNIWYKLKPIQVLTDSTNKLLRSGIVKLELPQRINKRNTILDDSVHWIKVTASKNIEMIGNTIDLRTQAVTATWVKESSNGEHVESFLPKEVISSTQEAIPEIASITQPVQSFGGKLKENDKQFYTRSSERLRHKNRAIVSRDYEQLILDKFPEIYKVNCLQSMNSHNSVAPGEVLIAIIPKINEEDIRATTPMANVSLLRDIKKYVQKIATPFVKIEVRNPSYERVRVVCAVRFVEGENNGETIKKLNYELKEFLSPWLYDTIREIRFGGEVNISDVSGFIHSRPYVDFVTKLSLLKISENEDKKFNLDDTARRYNFVSTIELDKNLEEEIVPSKPWSILVSASRHQIEILSEEEVLIAEQTGINDLELGNSFIID